MGVERGVPSTRFQLVLSKTGINKLPVVNNIIYYTKSGKKSQIDK